MLPGLESINLRFRIRLAGSVSGHGLLMGYLCSYLFIFFGVLLLLGCVTDRDGGYRESAGGPTGVGVL